MSRLFFIPVAIVILALYTENVGAKWAKCWKGRRAKNSEFGCYGVAKFSDLDKTSSALDSIVYHTSVLPNIPGNVFYRFRNSLKYLDLHNCEIDTIDSRAFTGLTKLRNLTLWGNKLTWISGELFTDLRELRLLDLSFNNIGTIEETAFLKIPQLEYFYIDYNSMQALNWNVFTYLTHLKKVKMGKNPWDWWFRAMISRQLDDQHVDYTSEWDDYHWINHVIWNCVEKHQARNDDGSILDCASTYLLKEPSKITNGLQKITSCSSQTKDLYDCTIRTDRSRNITITPAIAVRKVLEGFIGSFSLLQDPETAFNYRAIN